MLLRDRVTSLDPRIAISPSARGTEYPGLSHLSGPFDALMNRLNVNSFTLLLKAPSCWYRQYPVSLVSALTGSQA